MLTFRKYIDIKDDRQITCSCYAKSLKSEYIVLALSDNTLLVHSTSNHENATNILPWFKNEKICGIKFSNYNSLMNILTAEGSVIRVPICLLFQDETMESWETLVFASDPLSYIQELRSQKPSELKKKSLGKLGEFIKGYIGEPSSPYQKRSIYLDKNSSFTDIEILKVKHSNLKDPNDLSYVINVNKLAKSSSTKSLNDFYSNFSDLEIWNTHDNREIVIVSSMKGALFFISESKQVLVYCFDFGIVSLKLIKQEDKTSLILENDVGDHLILLLEKKDGDSTSDVLENFGARSFQINYTAFQGGASLLYQPSIENNSLKIYEHSNSTQELRIFDADLQVQEEYRVNVSNICQIIDWDIFLLVIHGYGSKLYFSLLLKQMIKIESASADKSKEDMLKTALSQPSYKNSKYFSKPLQNQFQIILEDLLEIDGNVLEVKQIKGSNVADETRDIFLCICSSSCYYFANTNLEAILTQLEQKFVMGDISKNDYILFDSLSKINSLNFLPRRAKLKQKLEDLMLYGVLFDIEIFDKIKHQEELLTILDFRETICTYLERDSLSSKKAILHLISEKILLDLELKLSTIVFYTAAAFYICWKGSMQKEDFEEFIKPKNLKILEQIFTEFEVPNILLESKLIHIILYLSFNFRLRMPENKGSSPSFIFETVLLASCDDPDLQSIQRGEFSKIYTKWLKSEYKNFPDTYALPIDIMQEKSTNDDNWTLICSLLASKDEQELLDILKILIVDLRVAEIEDLSFSLTNFSENWALRVITGSNNTEFTILFHHLLSIFSLKQELPAFDPKITVIKSLEDLFSSKLILTAYPLIFKHVNYLCFILMLLKNRETKNEKWRQLFSNAITLLKKNKFVISDNLVYACVTLDDLDSYNILKT